MINNYKLKMHFITSWNRKRNVRWRWK